MPKTICAWTTRGCARMVQGQLLDEQLELSTFTGQSYYYAITATAIKPDYGRQKSQLTAKIK